MPGAGVAAWGRKGIGWMQIDLLGPESQRSPNAPVRSGKRRHPHAERPDIPRGTRLHIRDGQDEVVEGADTRRGTHGAVDPTAIVSCGRSTCGSDAAPDPGPQGTAPP